MKDYKEMAQSVLERRDAYLKKKKKRQQQFIRYGIPTVCLILVVGCCTAVLRSDVHKPIGIPGDVVISSSFSEKSSLMNSQLPSSLPSTDESAGSQGSTSPSTSSCKSSPVSSSSSHGQDASSSSFVQSRPSNTSSAPTANIYPCGPSGSTAGDKNGFKYQIEFQSIFSLKSYLCSMGYSVVEAPSIQDPSSSPVSSIPDTFVPGESGDFWSSGVVEASPASKPDIASCPMPDIPPMSDPNDHYSKLWKKAWGMFETGTFKMPVLEEGNDLLTLTDIHVDESRINYYYQFRNIQDRSGLSYDLKVDVYAEKTALQTAFESNLKEKSYKQCTYGGITYTLFKSDNNYINCWIFWQQDGAYYRATYYGANQYITRILPTLRITTVSWQ